jgi:hypothetical protein
MDAVLVQAALELLARFLIGLLVTTRKIAARVSGADTGQYQRPQSRSET